MERWCTCTCTLYTVSFSYHSIVFSCVYIICLHQVFTSWLNRTGSATAPVSSSLIQQLKRLARLLHFCSSRLLLCPPIPISEASTEQATWFDSLRSDVLSLYIQYLKTLNFEEITEQVTTAPPRQREKGSARTPTQPPYPFIVPQKLYKCMQRSWTHGIILIELTFRDERFDVKLLTLESSRLNGQKSLSPEVCVCTSGKAGYCRVISFFLENGCLLFLTLCTKYIYVYYTYKKGGR